jgi:hypothetical protein
MLGNFGGQGRQGQGDDPFGISPFGTQDPFMGMGALMQQMGAGAAGGSSCCCSCSYSTSCGPNGEQVTYSSASRAARQGNDPMVSETHEQYWDSTGNERLGVARNLGNR